MTESKTFSDDKAIETVGLRKVYHPLVKLARTVAVDGLSLNVPKGQIYGFLGPNGAGKTTTVKMLLSLIEPTSGEAYIFGQRTGAPSLRNSIGYMAEHPSYYEYLSAKEFLNYNARLFKIKRRPRKRKVKELLEFVGLEKKASKKLKGFSRGMLQRVGLAQALINDPDLLILDEPMSGLDPIGRNEFKNLISNICRNEGKTVLICSHVLMEIEQICDAIGIISHGKLLVEDKIDSLLYLKRVKAEIEMHTDSDMLLRLLEKQGISIIKKREKSVIVEAEGEKQASMAKELVHQINADWHQIAVNNETLEDFFIRVVTEARSEVEVEHDA